jgi:hypothetical protein
MKSKRFLFWWTCWTWNEGLFLLNLGLPSSWGFSKYVFFASRGVGPGTGVQVQVSEEVKFNLQREDTLAA